MAEGLLGHFRDAVSADGRCVLARLCLAEGKTRYIALIPRIWTQLQRNLAHPALAKLRMGCARLLPEPTPATLLILEGRCSAFR